ncbi:thiol-disulfide oxidoreductase DCC [Artemisia annua]|uniref:Thiol-disulfide oxidoreductase DCC n=1 Tax=Artemisia annua TaxID=35608 RepID=A0A2U1KWD4_ARTAN|nr:thiol-disulfide oxidoreductase DCC [Artemisia annua]
MATRLSQSSVKQLAVEAMDARNKLLRKPSSTAEIINNLLNRGSDGKRTIKNIPGCRACQSGHKIDLGLRILYIVSTVIFALNLVAVIAVTVVGIVKIRRALHILLVLCWLITVFCWLFFGLYFFLSSSEDYSPDDNHGIDYETAMGKIHAVMANGTIVTNVEAFSKLYEAVGLGWVYAITKYEPVATIADAVYGVWAKYRLQVTGRPPLEEVLEARRKKDEICNDNKSCKM